MWLIDSPLLTDPSQFLYNLKRTKLHRLADICLLMQVLEAEACFSDDQTKLKWHLDQVGPKKLVHFLKEHFFSFLELSNYLA